MKVIKKIRSISLILSRLRNKKQVRPEEISKALGRDQYAQFKEHLDDQKSLDKVKRPKAIQKYAELVRIACLYYGKMETYSSHPLKSSLATKFSDKADTAFEAALEFLREAIEIDGELRVWIDRDVDELAGFCPVSIPRVIGSEHFECQNKSKHPYPKLSKRQLLIEYLEMALYELEDHTLEEFMTDHLPAVMYSKEKRNFDFSEFKFSHSYPNVL